MWAPTDSPAAAGRTAIPSLRRRRWPAAAGVRIVVAVAPVKARAARPPRRLLLCLAVPPASEMAAAAAAAEEEEEEEEVEEMGWRKAVELDAAVRREMAIRRLQEEAGTGSSRREFAMFETARGDALFTQSWTPVAADRVKGIVVLLHGLNEHSVLQWEIQPFCKAVE